MDRILFLALCMSACGGSTTRFEQMWRAPNAGAQKVVTLYESQDGAMRRTVEDKLARELAGRHIVAVPAHTLLGSGDVRDHEAARQTLIDHGFDGVVVVRLIGTEMYPGDRSTMATWGASWPTSYEDYVFDSPVVRLETTLYSLRDDTMLWSARSRTADAQSTNEVIDQVTSLVAATLQRQGVAIATAQR